MRKLDPSDIPEILETVARYYVSKERMTPEDNTKVNNFFMNYMDKGYNDCVRLSRLHWTTPRSKDDVALNHKTVEISAGSVENKVRFIVGSSFTPEAAVTPKKGVDTSEVFKENFITSILGSLSDKEGDGWTTVYNKLTVAYHPTDKAWCGLFIAIKFNDTFFEAKEAA